MRRTILIVEDDPLVKESLFEILSQEGYEVTMAQDGKEGLDLLADRPADVVLTDLKMPEMGGMEFLSECQERFPDVDVVVMTSYGSIESAVEAMKLGAADYLTKPINDEEIKILLQRIFETRRLKEENAGLREQLAEKRSHFHNIIGSDPKMQRIYQLIQAIQDTDTTVLLKGESGTGKGMVAQAIHYSDPARKDGPYVEVSCGAIPRDLLESELFGHVKGAFTSAIRDRMGRFEMANGGTILLDEIDALPPYLQVKLLRVLQQKVFEKVGDTKTVSVNVRIIAATNRDLEEDIRKGNFREDLYYRLNVITIEVPPLRARREDIPQLIEHFLTYYNTKTKRQVRGVAKDALKVLVNYDWPGNVRELENLIERACVLAEGDMITIENFPRDLSSRVQATVSSPMGTRLKDVLLEPEKRVIVEALEQTGWNRKKAAVILRINRTTLYNKMKKHNLL
ncbi:MAG: sigma-54-dependent Fis family transcriptional regulator [Candidatus Omnitrophica bacterium]|nr:sigma-54-dependent Fis family transcriptional regulator [Candidatus Omnitrophota bacterium]